VRCEMAGESEARRRGVRVNDLKLLVTHLYPGGKFPYLLESI